MTHLHLHTHLGSILDGIGKPSDYAILAKKYGHKACGITDHGRMGGIFEFQKQMLKQGIKPLLGCEFYVSDRLVVLNDKNKRVRTKNNHLVLFASNEIGYKNILKLNWLSMQDDHFYFTPRILEEEIEEYRNGLVAGTACIGSKIGRIVLDDKIDDREKKAEDVFLNYLRIFGDNLYGEIQLNELEQQHIYNDFMINICNKHGVPICITGDVHYSNKEDFNLQTLSIMIARKQTIDDMGKDNFFDIEAKTLYYTNSNDILEFNKNYGYNYSEDFINSCLDNTDMIADKINYKIPDRSIFFVPSFKDNEKILLEKIKNGIKVKLNNKLTDEYKQRLKKEVKLIKDANLIDYFLIVEDYHNYAKNTLNDFCGIGRGSGVGSLVLYLLDVTSVDPIKHGLIFERFLTPTRAKNDYPDVDSDFSKNIKKEIENYLVKKYGDKRVFHICTYTTFGLKSAAKDLLRIYKINYKDSNDFTKEIDNDLTWEENIYYFESNRQDLYNFYKENEDILNIVPRINGLVRNMGVHAGGLCILSKDINEIIPVDRVSGVVVTAFQESGNAQELDEIGIIKFDILGVKTLGSISETIKIIKERYEKDIKNELYNIDLSDKNIYKEIRNKNSYNLFQMTGKTYKEMIDKIKPNNWEEVNACNSMSRPGTISVIDDYLNGKKRCFKYGKEITNILKDTYGICLFQEQIIKIFNIIGGFSLEESEYVRKIMKKLSKKDKKKDDLVRWDKIIKKFKEEAISKNITKEEVERLTSDLINFSSYSFNKSHCYAYSYIGVITAYLSHYYRVEFYAASLNSEDNTDGIIKGLIACKLNNIKILPPNINKCDRKFKVIDNSTIAFGLRSIKNVGEKALDVFLENREYENFKDFITNPKNRNRAINSRVITSLILSGCFDETDGIENRKLLLQVMKIFWENKKQHKTREKLVEIYDKSFNKIKELNIKASEKEIQEYENEFLGYNFFHTKFSKKLYEKIEKLGYKFNRSLLDIKNYAPVLLLIEDLRIFLDKNKNEMAFAKIIDEYNNEKTIPLFNSVWKYIKDDININNIYIMILRNDKNQIMFGKRPWLTKEEINKQFINITKKTM